MSNIENLTRNDPRRDTAASTATPHARGRKRRLAGRAARAFGKAVYSSSLYAGKTAIWAGRKSWKRPKTAAAVLVASITVSPAAMRWAFVEATTATYHCRISRDTPITRNTYPDQPVKAFFQWPLGSVLGLRNSALNDQLRWIERKPESGQFDQYVLHAMCRGDAGGKPSGEKRGEAFEIRDTFWRSSRYAYRSSDLATEFAALGGKDVVLRASELRVGKWNWYKNVRDYAPVGP